MPARILRYYGFSPEPPHSQQVTILSPRQFMHGVVFLFPHTSVYSPKSPRPIQDGQAYLPLPAQFTHWRVDGGVEFGGGTYVGLGPDVGNGVTVPVPKHVPQ